MATRTQWFGLSWPRWLADAGLRLAFGSKAPRNYHAVSYWLSAGANPNQTRMGQGDTWLLLHVAAKEGDAKAVALLLEHGATIDPVASPHRETPLAIALREKHRECAELLTRAGANLDHACKFNFAHKRNEYRANWFYQYPSTHSQMSWGTWSSGYRTTRPVKAATNTPSMRAPKQQVQIHTLCVGCVDNANALAFAQSSLCEPTVRALMYNVGWQDLIDVHQACEQARQLSANWEPSKLSSSSPRSRL